MIDGFEQPEFQVLLCTDAPSFPVRCVQERTVFIFFYPCAVPAVSF